MQTVLVPHEGVQYDHIRLEVLGLGDGLLDGPRYADIVTLLCKDILHDLLDGDVVVHD